MENFGNGRRAERPVGNAVRKDGDHIVPLPLRFPDKRSLVRKVVPDPLIPVEKHTQGRPAGFEEFSPVSLRVRHALPVHIRMINPRQAELLRRLDLLIFSAQKALGIEPEIFIILHAPILGILLQHLDGRMLQTPAGFPFR